MSNDHNRWIISSHKFVEHRTIEAAQAELMRLSELLPQKKFKLFRIKRVVEAPNPDTAQP